MLLLAIAGAIAILWLFRRFIDYMKGDASIEARQLERQQFIDAHKDDMPAESAGEFWDKYN